MKRTIVYIDGFNLYYGLLRGTCAKWLDLYAFAKALLAPDHDGGFSFRRGRLLCGDYPPVCVGIEKQYIMSQH